MVMYNFVHPFREAKFCGVPSCVFDKLGCAAGDKSLPNTGLDDVQDNVELFFHDAVPARRDLRSSRR
jgi:hypothetical protein